MTGTNAELIAEARGLFAEGWCICRSATLGDRVIDAIEAADPTANEDLLYVRRMEAERDAALAKATERAAVIAETAFLTHKIGTPGEGPFTNGQRYADEARVQIAAQIRAAK